MKEAVHPNLPEYSVSEVAQAIKLTLEETFSYMRIRGEISGLKSAASGHIYFTLKDAHATLNSICWKNVAMRLPFQVVDGMEVICSGSISTFPGRSYYQLTVEKIEIAGVGALLAMLEKRKQKLQAAGIFNVEHKKPLPFLPKTIGIITSPTGAVIRDMLHRISERFPTHILLWGVLVQGNEAAEQISSAIEGFNHLPDSIPKPDLLIVARGGGSIEDLWAFNEEAVVMATYHSKIPIISAVGHETDTTLIDFAADKRAPTPTAAAEMAVPVLKDLKHSLTMMEKRLHSSLPRLLQNHELRLTNLSAKLAFFTSNISSHRSKLESMEYKLTTFITNFLNQHSLKLQYYERLLESFHYKKVLSRGFAIVRDKKLKIIKNAGDIKLPQYLNIEFYDGIKEVKAVNPASQSTHDPISNPLQKSLFDN